MYHIPLYIVVIYSLLFGATRRNGNLIIDFVVLHAGGVAETQFAHMLASVHHLTDPRLVSWGGMGSGSSQAVSGKLLHLHYLLPGERSYLSHRDLMHLPILSLYHPPS